MTMFEDQLEAQRESVRLLELAIAAEVKKRLHECVKIAFDAPEPDGWDIAYRIAGAFGYTITHVHDELVLVPLEEIINQQSKKDDTVTIPRKLAKTLLGILESEYEGTEMFQDEINELKGLL